MATYIKINDNQYPAIITGKLNDKDWDNRESKSITLEMSYQDAVNTFVDDVSWFILQEVEETIEEQDPETEEVVLKTITKIESYDNSEYNIAGDIVVHKNDTVTVKMGKPTAEELLAALDLALLDATYENLVGGME